MIDELTAWADDPDFRSDAVKFLSLSREAVDALVGLIGEHATFNIPAGVVSDFETKYELEGGGRRILAAARLIRSVAQRHDQDDLEAGMIDFAKSVGVESFSLRDFSVFFSWLPGLDMEALRDAAIQAAPTLVRVGLSCDLRVVSDPRNMEWGLVPVVFARLQFDENVAGQQALWIQLTEESVEKLKCELEKTQETLRAVRDRYEADLLPARTEE
ncbi:MAG: hypothetical protein F4137_04555 [Acidobacteria bacterium]|nr:hypothetical protein [Acidobacteriota bacterium]